MYNWQDYLAPQLPLMWQPNAVYYLAEVANNLHGVVPQERDAQPHPGGLVLREVTSFGR